MSRECDCEGSGYVVCPDCYGRGYFISCCDDLCRGADECMHGDGEEVCQECRGEGEVRCDCIERAELFTPDARAAGPTKGSGR